MHFLAVSLIKNLQPRGDDDFVDRLNYYCTPLILGVCAIVVSAKQYVGNPIQCWVPPQFTQSMEQYIESYCWIQNTYWLPMHRNIPDDLQAREARQIGYYQWVPFILLTEALLFCIPCLVWRLMNWQTGVNLHHLVTSACDSQSLESGEKAKTIESVSQSIQDVLDLHSGFHMQRQLVVGTDEASLFPGLASRTRFSCCWHRYSGSYVTILYLMVKLLYTANVVMQFFLLNAFLKPRNHAFYGIQVLRDLLSGEEWSESGHFPRVNLFNEKVFAFVWCWFVVLGSVTACSFIFWSFNTLLNHQRVSFAFRFLRIAAMQNRQMVARRNGESVHNSLYGAPTFVYERFVEQFLRFDGVFILRMLASHAGDIIAIEVIKNLWKEYRERDYFDTSPDSLHERKTEKSFLIAAPAPAYVEENAAAQAEPNNMI